MASIAAGDQVVSFLVEYAPSTYAWNLCSTDTDGDTLCDDDDGDICLGVPNLGAKDADRDGVPDACDGCPHGVPDWTSEVLKDMDGDGCRDDVEDDDADGD